MSRRIFIRSRHSTARDIINEQMGSFDTDYYRAQIAAGKIDELVDADWENFWATGDNAFPTLMDAVRPIHDVGLMGLNAVEVTDDDVRDALLAL